MKHSTCHSAKNGAATGQAPRSAWAYARKYERKSRAARAVIPPMIEAHRYFLLRSIQEIAVIGWRADLHFAAVLMRARAQQELTALGGMAGEW
jgi:hypothetical protein